MGKRSWLLAVLILLTGACIIGCGNSSAQPAASGDEPAATKMEPGKAPVGLFFMTRYWPGGTLEKAAWYFAPDGTVYENLTTGFSAADLAAHKGRKGKASASGKKLDVTWSDGKTTSSDVEPDKGTFMWDMGIFTPVTGFTDPKDIVGKYEGGESLTHDDNLAASAKTLDLRPDGTFSSEASSTFVVQDKQSRASAGGSSSTSGKWELKGYSLILTDDKGAHRNICFPFSLDSGPKPDHIFVGGTLLKRQ